MLGAFLRRKKFVLVVSSCHSGERYLRAMQDNVSELMHRVENCVWVSLCGIIDQPLAEKHGTAVLGHECISSSHNRVRSSFYFDGPPNLGPHCFEQSNNVQGVAQKELIELFPPRERNFLDLFVDQSPDWEVVNKHVPLPNISCTRSCHHRSYTSGRCHSARA